MPADELLAGLSEPFHVVREYSGGQGRTLCLAARDGRHYVLKVLPPGEGRRHR